MIGVGKRWGVGKDRTTAQSLTGDQTPDNLFRTIHRMVVSEVEKLGPTISPKGNRKLSGVINEVVAGEHIYLAAGTYYIKNPVSISKSLRITGIGRVIIVSEGEALSIKSNNVIIKNIEFVQRPDPASVSAFSCVINVRGSKCRIENCLFNEKQAYGIVVTGDQCAVIGCRFESHASQIAANSDVYFGDSASDGLVAGNIRSKTIRSYALSYKTGTDMSQSVNGPASAIEVRP